MKPDEPKRTSGAHTGGCNQHSGLSSQGEGAHSWQQSQNIAIGQAEEFKLTVHSKQITLFIWTISETNRDSEIFKCKFQFCFFLRPSRRGQNDFISATSATNSTCSLHSSLKRYFLQRSEGSYFLVLSVTLLKVTINMQEYDMLSFKTEKPPGKSSQTTAGKVIQLIT